MATAKSLLLDAMEGKITQDVFVKQFKSVKECSEKSVERSLYRLASLLAEDWSKLKDGAFLDRVRKVME